MCSVTAQGSANSQFKRALERRNFLLAWTMAAELPKVPLADALSLLLLALDQQPWRLETAAPRWHARLCEARLKLPEVQLALSAHAPMPRRQAVSFHAPFGLRWRRRTRCARRGAPA
jgi:hypothetical protein